MNIVDSLCKEAAYHAQQYTEKLAAANMVNSYMQKMAANFELPFASFDDAITAINNPIQAFQKGAITDQDMFKTLAEKSMRNSINTPLDTINTTWKPSAKAIANGADAAERIVTQPLRYSEQELKNPSMWRNALKWMNNNRLATGLGAAAGLAGLGAAGYGLYNYMNPSNEEAEMAKAGSYNLTPQEKVAMYRQAFLDM